MLNKILIVDDTAIERDILKFGLRHLYDIIEANSGSAALAIIAENYKELSAVLLDIIMPEMDGYQVLQEIRSNKLYDQLPVLITTGINDDKVKKR